MVTGFILAKLKPLNGFNLDLLKPVVLFWLK